MRKIKNKSKEENIKVDIFDEKESLYTKIIIALSFLIPFFALYIIYFIGLKLPKRTKKIMADILNKNLTMICVYLFMFTLSKQVYAVTNNVNAFLGVLQITILMFIFSIINQIIKSYQWLKGKDVKFKYTLKLFKEEV